MHEHDTTKPIHFAPAKCDKHNGNWGGSTSVPDDVTCPECKPVAAKHKRGAALQAYEEAETEHRKAAEELATAHAAFRKAEENERAAGRLMAERRTTVLKLLGGGAP